VAISEAADLRLRALAGEPVMMMVAAAGPDGRAALARGMGMRPTSDGAALDVFVSGGQWSRTLEGLRPGQPLALTLCRPATYETVQVKGPVLAVTRADADGLAWARAYVERTSPHLGELGVGDAQMRPWLRLDDLVQVRFAPDTAFEQTPGPRAGRPMAPPA